MKQSLNLIAYFILVIFVFNSCGKDLVDADSPAPARPIINAKLIPFVTLSQPIGGIAGSVGSKILFSAASPGYSGVTSGSSRVDIYDINANSWSTAELSEARGDFSVVTSGDKIFFAGGWVGDWWGLPLVFTNVDIYDAATDSWSVKHLSEPRTSIGTAAVGNKVFFAGGIDNGRQASSKVDIYDTQTNSWSTSALSEPRTNISTQIAENKIYFAGGSWGVPRATVDVYDIHTGSWSVSSMTEPKSHMASFATGSKIFWAGGESVNNQGQHTSALVEIKDVLTQSSTFSSLSEPKLWRGNHKAVVKNNQIIFFTGNGGVMSNKFDIYDTVKNSWSIGVLDQNIDGASIITVKNTIYVVGAPSNIVWKLEF